jgi:prepilin-type N-terminal cleavage/methylation domain-containing protein
MPMRRGFTLLEMLISTVLLTLVLIGLYGALGMQKRSNKHLFEFLSRALDADRGVVVLYRDIFQSDGNITLQNGEFDRFCLNSTSHSLHGLAQAKVCWIVAKEDRVLLRIEGNDYRLPLRSGDGVEIDEVMKPMALFDIQKDKTKVLVALQELNREPYVFVVQGVQPPPRIVRKKNNDKNNSKNGTAPAGSPNAVPIPNKDNPKNPDSEKNNAPQKDQNKPGVEGEPPGVQGGGQLF